jgi:hypothetical protein
VCLRLQAESHRVVLLAIQLHLLHSASVPIAAAALAVVSLTFRAAFGTLGFQNIGLTLLLGGPTSRRLITLETKAVRVKQENPLASERKVGRNMLGCKE